MVNYAQILIVDDMPDHISLTSSFLASEGYRVFAATNGRAARYFLERHIPDLILLDIQMGEVSGLEICRKLKSSARFKDVPVVFLTSETNLDVVSQAFELGASDYIKKPFAKEEFVARIKTQLRLGLQRKDLLAVNNELNQFCTAVTHDLKAPFTVVNMLIGMLQNELGETRSQQADEIMRMICMETSQAKTMIERLFEFSRMCNIRPNLQEVNVKAITEETFADLRRLCPQRDILFSCAPLPNITADETLVRMVMKNLLQNAVKYTSKKEKAEIQITAGHDPAFFVIQVQDNGAGFDMRYAGKLFQVFERLHRDEDFPGTGVGLATVSRVMKRHNGRIEAWGEVNQGAKFTLYFPKSVKPAK